MTLTEALKRDAKFRKQCGACGSVEKDCSWEDIHAAVPYGVRVRLAMYQVGEPERFDVHLSSCLRCAGHEETKRFVPVGHIPMK